MACIGAQLLQKLWSWRRPMRGCLDHYHKFAVGRRNFGHRMNKTIHSFTALRRCVVGSHVGHWVKTAMGRCTPLMPYLDPHASDAHNYFRNSGRGGAPCVRDLIIKKDVVVHRLRKSYDTTIATWKAWRCCVVGSHVGHLVTTTIETCTPLM